MMLIFSTSISTFLISTVFTKDLLVSSKTDIGQFMKKHGSKPFLKDNKWLVNKQEFLQRNNKLPPLAASTEFDAMDLDLQKPLGSGYHNDDIHIDQDILEISSGLKDFVKSARKEVESKVLQKRLKLLSIAADELKNLKRTYTSYLTDEERRAMRGWERRNGEHFQKMLPKKKGKDIWDELRKF